MRHRTLSTSLAVLSLLLALPAPPLRARGSAAGDIVVTLPPGVSIDSVNARYGTRTVGQIASAGAYKLVATDPAATLSRMRRDGSVSSAKRDHRIRRREGLSFPYNDPEVVLDGGEALYRAQTAPGGSLASLEIEPARDLAAGGAPVVVAVLDTGVDLAHPALAGRLWTNQAEVAGIDGVDDDGDGIVDDRAGYDFVDADADPSETGTEGPVAGHGTFIAGLVALASTNVRVMPLRVLDGEGTGSAFDAAAAIEYAVAHGAKVISISFGAAGNFAAPLLRRAVSDAAARGVSVVAAAGNDGAATLPYPASDGASVVAVGATDGAARADFSNYGAERDALAWAPGVALVSAMASGGGPPLYARWSGTSFATGLVSALAAAMYSVAPEVTSDSVREHLVRSDGYAPLSNAAGWRVDCLEGLTSVVVESGGTTSVVRSPLVSPGGAVDFEGSAALRVTVSSGGETGSLSLAATGLAPGGKYSVSLRSGAGATSVVARDETATLVGGLTLSTRFEGSPAASFPLSAATQVVVTDASGAVTRTGWLSTGPLTNVSAEVGLLPRAKTDGPRGSVAYVYAGSGGQTLTVTASGLEAGATYSLYLDGHEAGSVRARKQPRVGGEVEFRLVSSFGTGSGGLLPFPPTVGSVLDVRHVDLRLDGGDGRPVLSGDLGAARRGGSD